MLATQAILKLEFIFPISIPRTRISIHKIMLLI